MIKLLRLGFTVLALGKSVINVARAEELCSVAPQSYATAKTDYPDLAFAISAVEEYSIAAWYTDRLSTANRAKMLKDLTTQCSEDSRMTIVVYGIPSKDCNAGYSSGGSVSNTADYKKFLSELTTAVGTRKVLYVVEPDSVGLLAEEGGCGKSAGYLENLKVAIEALSANANAELYIDVGYWTLEYEAQRATVVTIMKDLATSGTLKGITINTSNYRTTKQVTELCTNFQTAMGKSDMNCIVDTSRNNIAPTTTDWCNVLEAGIGHPPTSETKIANLDYFMWIKPPGESDGTCSGGPAAGEFFETGFQDLWDKGYFVKTLGNNTIAQGGTDTTSSQSTSSQTTDTTSSQTTDASASETTDSSATSSQTTDASASATTDTSASATTDASASETTDSSATSSKTTDASASETTDASASETTDASASETTDSSATSSETTDASASETTDASASETTDASASASQPTSSQITDDSASQTAQDSGSAESEVDTTSSQSAATTPTTTEAPSQTTSNCKVRRRLRKLKQ